MKIIALDLSTKPGWAYFVDGELKEYDTLFLDRGLADFGVYPFGYIECARFVVKRLFDQVIDTHEFDHIVIEETTAGKNNYSQKILEFIHFLVISTLQAQSVHAISYIRTGVWRKITNSNQNEEEKKYNARYRAAKKKKSEGDKTRVRGKEGELMAKLDRKDYALRSFKEHFNVELPKKMEDACEAALIGLAFIKGAPVCDGTADGGTL